MNETATSKGMQLIAAYRAARLSQRFSPPHQAERADPGVGPGAAAEPALKDAPLSAIGIGPNMQIRLKQIGLRSAADLASASAADLRAALGEISRLADVEAWIAGARQLLRRPTP